MAGEPILVVDDNPVNSSTGLMKTGSNNDE